MQTPHENKTSLLNVSETTTTNDNLISLVSEMAKTKGPVFQLPAVRPTYVFIGQDALNMLDDENRVIRTPSVVPAQLTISRSLCDEKVAVLSLTNGEEHIRRRASWTAPGNLDREGILRAMPILTDTIGTAFSQWEKQSIFSLNQEVRRVAWRIATQLVVGGDADELILADYETFLNLNEHADLETARLQVIDWLEHQATHFQSENSTPEYCIAAQLARSGKLSHVELINEIKHGLGSVLFNWGPVTELLRQLSTDSASTVQSRSEIAALNNNFSLKSMGSTPHLMSVITATLRQTTPLPFSFAKAKASFYYEGVTVPAGAVLIGALHATNQLSSENSAEGYKEKPENVAFGIGNHKCPGADLCTVIMWQFAAQFLSTYDIQCIDKNDVPIWQNEGYFAPRGSFVKFSERVAKTAPLAPVKSDEGEYNELTNSPSMQELEQADQADRIAIVGAGITGLTLAHELRKRGFKNVTVFEKAPSIGGKADTVKIDGRPYNLGAHLCHGSMGVATLAKEVGVSLEQAPTYELWDIDNNQAITRSFEHYQQVEKLRALLAANPQLDQDSGFAATEPWTYSSILSWLNAHDLGGLQDIGPFFTGAGYGFLEDDVPASFFLKFAQHMTEDGWTPTGGYKHLLERVSTGLNVRCRTEVINVERSLVEGNIAEGNSDKASVINITTRTTQSPSLSAKDETLHHEMFDRLILTGPLEHTSQFLDLTDEEQSLFPRIKSHDYYTVVATLDIEVPHKPGLYIVPKNTSNSSDRGHTTAFERAFEESNVYHFFLYGKPGQSEESILENVREDARKLGGELAEVHVFQKWAYAPQVSPHDMALGFHRRLDQMQGQQGTYYAGSLLAFELTDQNVQQAKSLVERFFGDQPNAQSEPALLQIEPQQTAPLKNSPEPSPLSRLPEFGTQSILEILKERYEQTPNAISSTFLDTKGKPVRALTYKELVERAMACAISLHDKGVKHGDRVALVYPPDTDEFSIGFFGCLFAEAIAVPVACPDPRKLDIEIPRFAHLMNDCDCRVALTTRVYHAVALAGRTWSAITNIASSRKIKWPKLTWLSTDGLSPLAPTSSNPIPFPSASTVAYLQYTSGSTSNPKGVMINHGNILHNVNSIRVQAKVDKDSVLVGWVPLFHDMGLVGGPLTTLYCGAHLVFFSPMSFLQNPVLWVKSMAKYRATHTESPNFGYEFLLRNLDDESLKGIDLSCLTHALFGGEVMRPRTFERLATRLHETGFRAESMTNIFGAAEATLYLAGGGVDNPPLLSVDTKALETKRRAIPQSPNLRSTTTLIGCGIPQLNNDLRIVDPGNTRLLPDGEVGEVWLSSPSVSQGYWGRPSSQNDEVFRARIADDLAPLRTYLRTGDLGFIERDIVYICGRVKEMMIFNGRNIHPMDIELCVMTAHPSIRQGCVVAFSVEEQDQERLIIVAELKNTAIDKATDAANAIAQVLAGQHNLACKEVLLVRSGTLPKTSSGKLQRYRAREQYQQNQLEQIHAHSSDQHSSSDLSEQGATYETTTDELDNEIFNADVSTTKHWLKRLVASSLRVNEEEISTDLELSMFGIDSAQALAMTSRISKYVGYEITPSVLYEQPTINILSLYLCSPEDKADKVLVKLQQGDSRIFPALFCVHPVGGSAMAYLGLVEKIADEIPVYAFGNESNAAPSDDIVAMAKYYVAEMQLVQSDGPYYLLGYSFGGTVAYEMACQILSVGGEIGGVFLIDSPSPLYKESTPGPQLSEKEIYSDFVDTAILNQLIPDQLDDTERDKLRLRIDQNHRALANYRIDATNQVHPEMRMFRATDEAKYLRDSLRHPAFDRDDFGWNEVAPRSVMKVEYVPGDHFSVMNDPSTLAKKLQILLSEQLQVENVIVESEEPVDS
ncbi:MAG: FAD-dependent oxidoreductase [Pseudomonadales bacterium]|nr:FAD-dependent oxidoreductase [Pseudomonadales bacterium]